MLPACWPGWFRIETSKLHALREFLTDGGSRACCQLVGQDYPLSSANKPARMDANIQSKGVNSQ